MMKYLENLRKRPRHVRQRIALATTAFFSLMIGGVWWGTWSADQSIDNAPASKDISPVDVVVDFAGRAKIGTNQLVGEFMNQMQYNASGTPPISQTTETANAFKRSSENDIVYPEDVIDRSAFAGDASSSDRSASSATSTP